MYTFVCLHMYISKMNVYRCADLISFVKYINICIHIICKDVYVIYEYLICIYVCFSVFSCKEQSWQWKHGILSVTTFWVRYTLHCTKLHIYIYIVIWYIYIHSFFFHSRYTPQKKNNQNKYMNRGLGRLTYIAGLLSFLNNCVILSCWRSAWNLVNTGPQHLMKPAKVWVITTNQWLLENGQPVSESGSAPNIDSVSCKSMYGIMFVRLWWCQDHVILKHIYNI